MLTLSVAPGLRLVTLQPDDAEELFALTEANRAYLRRWLPWLDQTRALADTAHFIDHRRAAAAAGTGLTFGIHDQNVLVGLCGYNRMDSLNRCAGIGYWLTADFQGRGIMSRCVSTLTEYGFSERGLHRQVIACAEGNQASAGVATRCGFQFEGVARDAEWLYEGFVGHRIYARLRTDV